MEFTSRVHGNGGCAEYGGVFRAGAFTLDGGNWVDQSQTGGCRLTVPGWHQKEIRKYKKIRFDENVKKLI